MWDFAAQETLEALHARNLAKVMQLLDKPLRTLEAMSAWRDEVAALQRSIEGESLVTAAPAPAAQPTPGPAHGRPTPPSCARGVHSYGPPDPISGWAKCSGCGYVSITGGAAMEGNYNVVETPHGVQMP